MEQPQNIIQPPFVMQQQLNNLPAVPKLQEHKWKISKCEGTSVMRVKCSPGEQMQFCIDNLCDHLLPPLHFNNCFYQLMLAYLLFLIALQSQIFLQVGAETGYTNAILVFRTP